VTGTIPFEIAKTQSDTQVPKETKISPKIWRTLHKNPCRGPQNLAYSGPTRSLAYLR
jgi:hypothetical protein